MKHVCPHCSQPGIEATSEQLGAELPNFQCQICRAKSCYRVCPKCKKAYFFRAPAQSFPDC